MNDKGTVKRPSAVAVVERQKPEKLKTVVAQQSKKMIVAALLEKNWLILLNLFCCAMKLVALLVVEGAAGGSRIPWEHRWAYAVVAEQFPLRGFG